MRKFLHILLLLLPLFACTRELDPVVPVEPENDAPEGTVLVNFSFSVPAEDPATKALGEESQLTTMHLAIFGSSGYYKDYKEATRVYKYIDDEQQERFYPLKEERTFYRDDGSSYTKTVDVYHFQAEVNLANTARVIHFIGNGPATIRVGNAAEVLPSELSGEGETGFWQMVRLPAIKAKTAIGIDPETKKEYEYFVDQNGGTYGDDPNDRYVISDETKKYFQFHLKGYDENGNPDFSTERGIPLIRNWAKVTLKNATGSNFTPISFAVVHVPKQGTLVPYGGKSGFIEDYQDQAFDYLIDPDGLYAYKGNLPEKENMFDETIPDASFFDGTATTSNENVKQYDVEYDSNWTTEHGEGFSEDDEPAVYLYERPVPTDNIQPSYVIVYGTYLRADDPIFMAANAGDGWPTRDEYNNNPEGYSTFLTQHTKDESLTFTEYYEGVKCYYKVDFMAGGEYYPILRNFKYQVEISRISARGHSTPEDAAYSAGSADVSANINASHLADISDGTRRMVVQPWMAQTFIEADDPDEDAPVHLHVKFFDDINDENGEDGGINYDEERDGKRCVTWSFVEEQDNGVISDIFIGPAPKPSESETYNPDVHGWRPVYFRVLEPDKHVAKTQTLRISCMSYLDDTDEKPLYRDIVITLQPRQEMRVRCERESIPKQAKESQTVTISIPDGLPRSMFPLEFIVEPEQATLTPSTATDTENLPVSSGKSIIPGKEGKTAIQFKRTVSWDLYKNTAAQDVFRDETRWRSFHCHFISNCSDNATVVWVADKAGYFLAGEDNERAHDGFTNYSSFHTPTFKTSIPREIPEVNDPANVKVETGVYSEDLGKDNYFFMEAVNLTPVSAEGATFEPVEGEENLYKFVPGTVTIVFDFKTKVADGNVSLKFKTADDAYVEASLTPSHFRNVGIVEGLERNTNSGSDVAYRHVSPVDDKYFLVSCYTDQKDPTPQISVKDWNGVKQNSNSFSAIGDYYRERWFQTVAGTDPVSLTLSAVGYVEESVSAFRYKGNIYNWDINSTTLKGLADGASIGKDETKNSVKGSFSLNITSTVEGKTPATHDNGILLPRGGHYNINAGIGSNNSDVFLYYIQFHYLIVDGTPQKPYDSSVEPHPDGSSYSAYPGNEYVYMWSIPWGETAGSLELTAPAGRDIVITRMILRGFHGILLDTSDTGGDIGLGDNLNDGGGL